MITILITNLHLRNSCGTYIRSENAEIHINTEDHTPEVQYVKCEKTQLPINEGEDGDEQIDRGIPLQRSDLFS